MYGGWLIHSKMCTILEKYGSGVLLNIINSNMCIILEYKPLNIEKDAIPMAM